MSDPKTYLMIGAGGTGTHFIGPALAYLEGYHRDRGEEWEFAVIDGDAYDMGNMSRQLFDPGMVTQNKADVMALMYNRYPVIAVPAFVGKDDLTQMFNDGDTVFICADNHSIRALVEARALELDNATVINGGNELHDGNVQLWIREKGKNLTPRLSYLHPEIAYSADTDRAPMSCQQAAALPGGGQLILANQQSAAWMLAALWRRHTGDWKDGWTELQFDLKEATVHHIDQRKNKNWTLDKNPVAK